MIRLAGQQVGAIGFGLMGLTWRPEPYPLDKCFEVLRAALQNGSMKTDIHFHFNNLADRSIVRQLLERRRVLRAERKQQLSALGKVLREAPGRC